MIFIYDSKTIQTIINQIQRYELDLTPRYQQGYIWSSEFKDYLLFSIIKGYPIGTIILKDKIDKNKKDDLYEVVDGQQRLITIYNFIVKDYTIKGKIAKKIIEHICEYSQMVTDKKQKSKEEEKDAIKLKRFKKSLENNSSINLTYNHLPSLIQENINSFNILITNIITAKDYEINLYIHYLQNREVLRAGEIINLLPDSELENYLCKIEDKERFLKILKFKNDRKQFDKVFYSIIGLLTQKIPLGVMDKSILTFISECKVLTQEADTCCKRLIDQINYVTYKVSLNFVNANIRFMKSFLLLAAYGFVDFKESPEQKLFRLDSINEKLS